VGRWLRVAVQRTGGTVADVDVTVAITTAASSSIGKAIFFIFSLFIECCVDVR